jgi:hypothetical protein
MNTGRNTVIAYFAVVAVLLVGVLRFAHLPSWASVALVLAFAAAPVLTLRHRLPPTAPRSLPPESVFQEAPEQSPVERRVEDVTDVLLPTKREDYYFQFTARVFWLPTRDTMDESMVNLSAVAVDAVLARARRITLERDPDQSSLVRHELGLALADMREDVGGHLRAMAESVELVLPVHDQVRLDKLASVRKDEDVWEHERRYEQNRREYLGGDVLKTPGSAVVWWLTKNDDQVDKTVQDIGSLVQLSWAANDMKLPGLSQQSALEYSYLNQAANANHIGPDRSGLTDNEKSAADHFGSFLRAMGFTEGNPQAVLFARQVADLAVKHERQELADEIMHRFDASEDVARSWETNDGG